MIPPKSEDLIPVVTQEEFDAITCNRCGDCCESLWFDAVAYIDAVHDVDRDHHYPDPEKMSSWLKQLRRIDLEENYFGQWHFSCPRFTRDVDGLGVCTTYEERPHPCSMFPYGRPQVADEIPNCSWRVQIRG